MTAVRLKRLLTHNRRAIASMLDELIAALESAICIQDATGAVLLGIAADDIGEKHPIECDGETIGWVVGGQGSQALTRLLAHLASREAEKESLADEILNRYREINLLYNLSEKLATSLELKAVCTVAIEEAKRLIKSTGGTVMLVNEHAGRLEAVAGFGPAHPPVTLGDGVVGTIAQTAKAEIVNDVHADQRHNQAEAGFSSLLCAPLQAKGRLLGVIVLASESPVTYTAGDLKLLSTLASQSAPAIENALLYEKTLQEAKEREERLQRQIQALRIELDETKQAKKVAEITETDYFKSPRQQADDLRSIMGGSGGPT